MVWNCRGAASNGFVCVCKQYVTTWNPAMLVIMETRCHPDRVKKYFIQLRYHGFLASNNEGFAGGICVGWKKDCMQVHVEITNFQFLHLQVQYDKSLNWCFTSIYASPNEESMRRMWNELGNIARQMAGAWMLVGDFNDIMSVNEKRGGCQLILADRILERLDKGLCNERWRIDLPHGYVKVLPRLDFSDHHPLLIFSTDGSHARAAKHFRFESAWLLDDSYNEMLITNWDNDQEIWQNMRHVEKSINDWKFTNFDQVRLFKKELVARIGGIQRRLQMGMRSCGLAKLEVRLQNELHDILKKEELMWIQRSRARWIRDGDRNTKYYHTKAVTQRRKNNILMIRGADGQWLEDADQIRIMVNNFYKDLFTLNQFSSSWQVTKITFPRLSKDLLEILNASIVNKEVKRAIFNMNP
ncbi:uncharacterized protein LOC131604980 [Vicia villosa]|uniref:uncharacterized protein LOC131604980 n=1 Tax=Vicia villosa TaxID=3911 RepID=UPI00273C7B21|nr:uncharacterized protein LOC131604980 [Vicia villosa]